jgi:hypothetical protein
MKAYMHDEHRDCPVQLGKIEMSEEPRNDNDDDKEAEMSQGIILLIIIITKYGIKILFIANFSS